MLELRNLTINHLKDLRPLIDQLTLTVQPGDRVAIFGEEGSGKSTLLKLLVNPEVVAPYTQVSGEWKLSAQQVAYLPQELPGESLKLPISAFLYQDLDYTVCDVNLFYRLAGQMGFPAEKLEDSQQPLGQLSGGERLKLHLLKLLAMEPDLLLLDEPSSDLDQASLVWLETFLADTGLTMVFISHDTGLLCHLATKIIHLEQVKKRRLARSHVSHLGYKAYLEGKKASFERQLQVARKEREDHESQMVKLRGIKSSVHHQLNNTKSAPAGRLLAKKMKSLLSQEKRFERAAESFTALPDQLETIGLDLSQIRPLPSQKILLNLNEQLPMGQICKLSLKGQDKLAIVGNNGVGKTSLLRVIYQKLLEKGDLTVTYLPQLYTDLLPDELSALDFLCQIADEEPARTLLAQLQFTREELIHTTSQLSGGQKTKLFLARAYLSGSQVLLLDEPTRHLSPTSQQEFYEMLQHYPGAVVLVSHDRQLLAALNWSTRKLDGEKLH